jgi:hypothetical protein
MNVGVLGTGMVGSAIASRLVGLGHEVKMGSRQAGNEKAREWAAEAGPKASEGSFADAAAFAELVFNCTAGEHSIAALGLRQGRQLIVVVESRRPPFRTRVPVNCALRHGTDGGSRDERRSPGYRHGRERDCEPTGRTRPRGEDGLTRGG